MRLYALGDIHGQTARLAVAHARIAADKIRCDDPDAPVVHLGDLVAKGPDSRGVIETLMEGQAAGQNWVVLKGNHDRMFAMFLADPEVPDPGMRPSGRWIDAEMGGDQALLSYGVRDPLTRPLAEVHADAVAEVPPAHRRWLEALPSHWLTQDALFVHAGIRPGVDLQAQTETDMLWIGRKFRSDTRDHGVLVVHGHRPGRLVRHRGNRINVDTKASRGGPVSAIVLEDGRASVLTDTGRIPLDPGTAA